jgi:hypothetical protein
MAIYSAKLLFQFLVEYENGKYGKMRTCEERIIQFNSNNGRNAVKKATKLAKLAEFNYTNSFDRPVYFQFIGVMELMNMDCFEGEVWHDIKDRLEPMENKNRLIPPVEQLQAIRCNE